MSNAERQRRYRERKLTEALFLAFEEYGPKGLEDIILGKRRRSS